MGSTSPGTNRNTLMPFAAGAWAMAPADPRRVLAALLPVLGEAAAAAADAALVSVVDPAGRVVGHARLAPGEAVTIGRHTQCRLRVSDDDFALRQVTIHHAAARVAGQPEVRVWDLSTGHPFLLEDGSASLAASADGPLFFSIGRYGVAVLAFDLAAGLLADPEHAWSQLPARELISSLRARSPAPSGVPAPAAHAPRCSTTMVRRLPGALPLANLAGAGIPVGEISVVDGLHQTEYIVTDDDLQRGVLFGRYERCSQQPLRADEVSRVHLLLAGHGQDIWAIDTASSCGTRAAVGAIEQHRLADRDQLLLAEAVLLRWRRLSRQVSA